MAETGKQPNQRSHIAPVASPDESAGYHEQRQQPADVTHANVTYHAQKDIEKGSGPDRNQRPQALKAAVEDLDNGAAVKTG